MATETVQAADHKLLIAGEWVDTDEWSEVRSPYDGTVVGRVAQGDTALVDRCAGPTLDVGCGPGRLAGALVATGVPAMGVDVNAEAVRQARRRGVPTMHRDVFRPLVRESTHAAIIVHNHPSGSCQPSEADRLLTGQLVEAGRAVGIPLLDHIVIAQEGRYSFAENQQIDGAR